MRTGCRVGIDIARKIAILIARAFSLSKTCSLRKQSNGYDIAHTNTNRVLVYAHCALCHWKVPTIAERNADNIRQALPAGIPGEWRAFLIHTSNLVEQLPSHASAEGLLGGGFLQLVTWGREHDWRWDTTTCARAADGGHQRVLRWLREHGCPWEGDTCGATAVFGYLDGSGAMGENLQPWRDLQEELQEREKERNWQAHLQEVDNEEKAREVAMGGNPEAFQELQKELEQRENERVVESHWQELRDRETARRFLRDQLVGNSPLPWPAEDI